MNYMYQRTIMTSLVGKYSPGHNFGFLLMYPIVQNGHGRYRAFNYKQTLIGMSPVCASHFDNLTYHVFLPLTLLSHFLPKRLQKCDNEITTFIRSR